MRECSVCQHDAAMHDPEDGCHFFRCKCAKFSQSFPAAAPPAGTPREVAEPTPSPAQVEAALTICRAVWPIFHPDTKYDGWSHWPNARALFRAALTAGPPAATPTTDLLQRNYRECCDAVGQLEMNVRHARAAQERAEAELVALRAVPSGPRTEEPTDG